jgi:flagellar motor switch protein FliM
MGVVNQESDPLIVQIVAGSEMVILVGYEVYIGETVGSMNMCVPLMSINPILDQISSQAHYQRHLAPELKEQNRRQIESVVRRATVPVEPVLGSTRFLVSDLWRLQPGDIVTLDSASDEAIPVRVGGVTRFMARPGKRGEHSSVQLVSIVQDE